MATNLQIDDELINKAVALGNHRTKKAAVTEALQKYVQHLQQQKIVELFGKIEYFPEYDYKKERKRRR
ncbi:MAG: type II toxin-antitoxin system VapB family antitoxin [Candidatus Hydrogenedentes bacterium]|nr:type II toxin-antitoxin system VapB family antitoxin [Candidatus Hydrogenedentota bacterium]